MTSTGEGTSITTGQAEIWKGDNGIIYLKLLPHTLTTAEDMRAHSRAALQLNNNQPGILLMVLPAPTNNLSADARAYTGSKEMTQTYAACAVIATNVIHKIIGNFIMNFNPPKIPLKQFSNTEEATDWLLSFK